MEIVENGNVTFVNNASGKIVGKGVVSLSNGIGKAKNMLFFNGLKHNIINMSQMYDQGYDVIFEAKNCQIKSTSSSEVIIEVVRTYNNMYVLKEKKERCYLSNFNKSWLWHRRLGHLNFD